MRIPRYRRRKDRDSAYVEMDGQRIGLPGRVNSPESLAEYRRLLGEYLRSHGVVRMQTGTADATVVSDLVRLWLRHCRVYYGTSNTRSNEYANCVNAARLLLALLGTTPIGYVGATQLEQARDAAITGRWTWPQAKKPIVPWSRSYTNAQINKLKRMFRWGVTHGLVSAEQAATIAALPPLKRGRTLARETAPVEAVPDAVVDATLPFLPTVVQAMVGIHRLTGMRSDNLCSMRPMDIDRSAPVWLYRPAAHKGSHRAKDMVVTLGPKCQAILTPYLDRPADAPCFCPREASRRSTGRRAPGTRYTTGTYRNAVRRAVKRANKAHQSDPIPMWHPHQLRHTAADNAKRA